MWIVEAHWPADGSHAFWFFDGVESAGEWVAQLYANGALVTWLDMIDSLYPVVEEPGCRPV
jgi:hypothetical protein